MGMLGFGKRRRDLEIAAKKVTGKLLQGAVLEDRRSRGDSDGNLPSSEDVTTALAAWSATAGTTWTEAKNGDAQALRQTARNYLFGTGMPVKPRQARYWLEAATQLELGPFGEEPSVDPFWDDMRMELNQLLTGKEHRQVIEDARDWVKVHRDLRR